MTGHDLMGELILCLETLICDPRLVHDDEAALFPLIRRLVEEAIALAPVPDTSIWEFRSRARVHTFSSVMCWAACDRLAKIAARLGLPERARRWQEDAARIHRTINERAWNAQLESYVVSFEGDEVDASLLLLEQLGFVAADDPRFAGTVRAIERQLKHGELIFRYVAPDDFGAPQTAFTICTFWYIDALAALGRADEARVLFERMLAHRNHVGLLSEDVDVHTGELWGNFPQTYSMVGLINSALRLSKSWEEGL